VKNIKKMLLVLPVLALLGYIFFANKASTEYNDLPSVRGTIESISLGDDPLSGNKSEIVLVDQKGQRMQFSVRTGIGVDVAGKDNLISLKKLKPGDMITVEYIKNRNGTNKVMSIELYSYQAK